jgi:hypothetical protein
MPSSVKRMLPQGTSILSKAALDNPCERGSGGRGACSVCLLINSWIANIPSGNGRCGPGSGWLWLKREGFFIFGIDSTVYNQEELPLRFRSVEGFTDTEHMRHQFMTFFGSEIAALFVRFLDSCL